MKRDIFGKLLEILIPDLVTTLVFIGILKRFIANPIVREFWWAPALIVIGYMAYENVRTVKDKEAVGQGA